MTRLILPAVLAGLAWILPSPATAASPDLAQAMAAADFESGPRLRAEERAETVVAPPSMRDVISAAFSPQGPAVVAWAENVAWCESKYDPLAVNEDSNAQGLFQFLPSTWLGTPEAASSPFDPVANAQAAAWLYATYGPSQWECSG